VSLASTKVMISHSRRGDHSQVRVHAKYAPRRALRPLCPRPPGQNRMAQFHRRRCREVGVREASEALRTCGEDSQTPGRSHRSLFPLLEAVLVRMLEVRGLRVERQVSVAFDFNGMHFDEGLRDFAPSRESECREHAKTPFSVRWKTFCWNCRTASRSEKTSTKIK